MGRGKCGMQGRRDREVRGEAADGDGDALGRGMTGDGVRIGGRRRGDTGEQKWWRW